MEARTGIAIAVLLVGCAQPQISNETTETIAAVSPTSTPRPAPPQKNTPRRLKLRLTLDRPEDLKVKVGDEVVKGQLLSERSAIRTRLMWKRNIVRRKLKQLQRPTISSLSAVEKAEVEQARFNVEQARSAISAFHADSPWTDYARSVLPISENIPLRQLQNQYLQAKGELVISIAKLQDSQQRNKVLQHSSTQTGELTAQLQEIEEKLNTMGLVHSPINGWIKSIKWVGQTNRELQIEMTVTVRSKLQVKANHPKAHHGNVHFFESRSVATTNQSKDGVREMKWYHYLAASEAFFPTNTILPFGEWCFWE
ncbi:hypothetical protein AM10699_40240 [Acaryochloris marina MBIC10699]|nr:hypothetical protein AM10699_40240 [Acaryochloris marina MBIC10699]